MTVFSNSSCYFWCKVISCQQHIIEKAEVWNDFDSLLMIDNCNEYVKHDSCRLSYLEAHSYSG